MGLVVIVLVAYLFSTNRSAIKPRVLFWGLGLQFGFAFLVLRTNVGFVFQAASNGVNHMLEYAVEGSKFLFGDKLGVKNDQFGVIFAFQVLPIIIFIASFFAILYYLGVMQIFVRGMAVLMQRVFATSGAESTNVAASIFMGQTEAPADHSSISRRADAERIIHGDGQRHGSRFGRDHGGVCPDRGRRDPPSVDGRDHDRAGHFDAGEDTDAGNAGAGNAGRRSRSKWRSPGVNIIDAASRGASDGLQLALNVGAMLIAFIGLIAMVNGILKGIHGTNHMAWVPASVQDILGHVFAPIAWLLGVKYNDCAYDRQSAGHAADPE